MHLEHEIALDLGQTDAHEAFAYLSRRPHCTYVRTTQLLNIYFDTPDHALRQAKAALRLRYDTEADCWIQTLKTAGHTTDGMSVRQEWETLLPTAPTNPLNPPAWQLSLFAPAAQTWLAPIEQPLHAVFHTDFQRDIFDCREGENHFECAIDYGEIRLANAAHADIHIINDLEIEYKKGDINAMQNLARQIQTALSATVQTRSKAARGYSLSLIEK